MRPRETPLALDARGAGALREALVSHGYHGDAVADSIGMPRLSEPGDVVTVERRLPESTLGTLVRLFVLARPVPHGDAAAALAPFPLADAVGLGLLAEDGGSVRALVRLEPARGLLIASDHSIVTVPDPAPDHVVGVHTDTRRLANLTVPWACGRALDVGTGCGVLALLLAGSARSVVATDVLPRALGFTRFNALLNGIDNVEVREGSFLEPVRDERFDLVVGNPPYVVSPELEFTYRDAGLGGDSVSRMLVEDVPGVLADGGSAVILVSWLHGSEGDWSTPVRAWAEAGGADAVLLRWGSEEPLDHAAAWNSGTEGTEAYEAAIDRWVEHVRLHGGELVGYGAVALRRRPGGGGFAAHDVRSGVDAPAAAHLRRLLDGLSGPDGLLDRGVRLVEEHRLAQTVAVREGSLQVQSVSLRSDSGLGLAVTLDRGTLDLLLRIDRRPLRQVLAEVEGIGDEDREAFERAAAGAIGRLRELGLVEVVSG